MDPHVPPTDPPPAGAEPGPLIDALRVTRRSVVVLLICCAVVAVLGGLAPEEPPPDRTTASLGVGLGLGTIVLRRLGASPVIGPRAAVGLILASLVLAGGLGLLGVWVAYRADAGRTGLLLSLAGLIFTLRPTWPAATRAAP